MTRKLVAEHLEFRRMLASDCRFTEETQFAEVGAFVAGVVSANDAGATRATAVDIGNISGVTRLSGSLNWTDQADTVKFSVARNANVNVLLSGLNRDADLYLWDSQGRMMGQSTRAGNSSEQISLSLETGDYYLTVIAQTFRSIQYQLAISVELKPAPAPIVSPNPVVVGAPTSGVAPLAEVANYGGNREWNLNAIGAPEAWAAGYTGQGVTVAIVDTGVDLDHPDLVNNLFVNAGEIPGNGMDDDANGFVDDVNGYDFADRDANPNDVSGHGTHVAGTVAASKNSFGATGVAPHAKILPVRVLGADGSGSTLDVAAGIRYAADLGANIINLSLGGGYSRAIEQAIDYARSLGSFIVAAAGNESSSTPGYPARFSASDDNVISVGAQTSSGNIASFSNDVGASRAVQVDAPGVSVYSTYVGGGYATLSGTSMAAPHVAGLAALVLSANPSLTTRELRDLLSSGTIGKANGSDAIGSANAKTSVAYAAAGITGGTNAANAKSATSFSNGTSSLIVRTTAIDMLLVGFDLSDLNDESLKNESHLVGSTIEGLLEQRSPAKLSVANSVLQIRDAVDFALSDDDDAQANSEVEEGSELERTLALLT